MVYPSLGCLTCRRRHVKVSRASRLSIPTLACLSQWLTKASAISPGRLVVAAAKQAVPVPGSQVTPACASGVRMHLHRADQGVLGNVRTRTPPMSVAERRLSLQRLHLLSRLPCLFRWSFMLSITGSQTLRVGKIICMTLAMNTVATLCATTN